MVPTASQQNLRTNRHGQAESVFVPKTIDAGHWPRWHRRVLNAKNVRGIIVHQRKPLLSHILTGEQGTDRGPFVSQSNPIVERRQPIRERARPRSASRG
jgi:hypothetical protein